MNRDKAKQFIKENYEALKILADKVRKLKDITEVSDEIDLKARKHAVEIIDGWISDLIDATSPEIIQETEEEDPTIMRLEQTKEQVEP